MTPDSPPTVISTGTYGPLPQGTVGLILGRSSLTAQGLIVSPGVIDSDYEGEIKVIVQPPVQTQEIRAGQRIAQLLLLPYVNSGNKILQQERRQGGFGSSNLIYWIQEIQHTRPMKTLKINGKEIQGLLDTGADISCIALKDWSHNWPLTVSTSKLTGLGTATNPSRSAASLTWESEGETGSFQPYVLPGLPCSLWGRDILSAMGILLYSPSPKVTTQMINMAFDPQRGLGKNQQGSLSPYSPHGSAGRQGLGYPEEKAPFVKGPLS